MELPDGRRLRGTGIRRPRHGMPTPDFAVYLLGSDPQLSEWPNRWVRWRDFGLPRSDRDVFDALREAHARAETERVEIACRGGVGRTGAALAAVAILGGVRPEQAVAWMRTTYHPRAVESARQRRWIETTAARGLRT